MKLPRRGHAADGGVGRRRHRPQLRPVAHCGRFDGGGHLDRVDGRFDQAAIEHLTDEFEFGKFRHMPVVAQLSLQRSCDAYAQE